MTMARRMSARTALLLVAGLLAGCGASAAPLSYSNQTTIPVELVVNGTSVLTVAPGAAGDIAASSLPGQPWDVRATTAGGRLLLALVVKSGDVQNNGNSQRGDATRVDLS